MLKSLRLSTFTSLDLLNNYKITKISTYNTRLSTEKCVKVGLIASYYIKIKNQEGLIFLFIISSVFAKEVSLARVSATLSHPWETVV